MRLLRWSPVLMFLSATVLSQPLPVQPCSSDALDVTFQAKGGPGFNYTIAINLRNISGETCWVGNHPGGTGVDPNRASDGSWIKICYYCEQSQKPNPSRIMLAPGDSVHQTRSWKTWPTEPWAKCLYPTEMSWGFMNGEWDSNFRLFSPSLLKPICSRLVTTDYETGPFLSDKNAVPDSRPAPVIRWINQDNFAPTRDHIPLRVTIEDPGHVLSLDQHSCPRLFVRLRDATTNRVVYSRTTRVDEIQQIECKVRSREAPNGPSAFTLDFDASYAPKRNDENKGEYTLEARGLEESNGRYLLVGAANSIHLSMVNGKFVQRTWGPPSNGIAVALTLDKDIYESGSDIPLHIALENFSSLETIAWPDPGYDPPGVSIELLDSTGQPIQPGPGAMWMGHGSCGHYIPGLVVPVELTLSEMGYRPEKPGVYTVVAVWTPTSNPRCFPGPNDKNFRATSPSISFRIIPKASP